MDRRLADALASKRLDALLATDQHSVFYLTGCQRLESSAALATAERVSLVVPDFEATRAEEEARPGVEVVRSSRYGDRLGRAVRALLPRRRTRVGLPFRLTTHATALALRRRLETVRWLDATPLLDRLRAVKAPWEVERIRRACEVTRRVLERIGSEGPRAATEGALRARIASAFLRGGGEEAFPSIVAAGPHSRLPHAETTTARLGGILLVDCGARYRGYCSDMTRTFPATEEQEEAVSLLRDAQRAAIRAAVPGASLSDVDAAARAVLGEQARRFTHALGHGVGIAVHEEPSVSKRAKGTVERGMVFTVEPGIYLDGWGARWEDCVHIQSRARVL